MGGVDHNLGYGHGSATISIDSFFNVSTASNAMASISVLDGRLDVLSNYQAQLGATVSRLTHSVDALSVGKINITGSLSVLSDSDYAS